MSIIDFFRSVDTMSSDEVREFLKERDARDYNLVDVRQQKEYDKGHIPGARLIPVGELDRRAGELDRDKPTITY